MQVYREQTAGERLSPWVECGWFLENAEALAEHRVPPDGCVDILYDRRDGLRVIGTMTVEQRFDYPEGASMTGVRFRPGMAGTFLGVSPAEMTDSSAALADVWPRRARTLEQQLGNAKSIQEAMRLLLASLEPPSVPLSPVQRA